MKKDLKWLFLITVFSLVGMKALFHPGLFTAHDIGHQVIRIYYYFQAINEGKFFPNWISQLANGYGYPLFFFSYQLPWIIGVPLLKIGFDIPNTIKILFFLSFLLSGISMYFFIKSLFKNSLAAFLSSILYMWNPYHFLIILVGASMGIAFVFIFLPMVFWGINLIRENQKWGPPILASGILGIILSHTMHIVFLSPILLIFFLWSFFNTENRVNFLKKSFFGLTLGILISSFYLIPAIYYNKEIRVHKIEAVSKLYERNFVDLKQLVYSKWGYPAISNTAKTGELSFQIGIIQWISVFCLILLLFFRRLPKTHLNLSIYLLIGFTVSILLMLDPTKSIWDFVEKFIFLDFPFRLILPSSFIASIFAAVILVNFKKERTQIIIFLIFLTIALYTNRNHLNVVQYTNIPLSTYLKYDITSNGANEYLPKNADNNLLYKSNHYIEGEALSASNINYTTTSLTFNLGAKKETSASVGQFYFPGQKLYVDGKIKDFNIDKQGRISFNVLPGEHIVSVEYKETPFITFSKFLSILGVIVLLLQIKKFTLN